MPNNVQILAYVQAMKDQTKINIKGAVDQINKGPFNCSIEVALRCNKRYLKEIECLENFIKGEDQ